MTTLVLLNARNVNVVVRELLGDEETPIPSDGAPKDLLRGGSIPHIWSRIDELDKKVDNIIESVAYIKGKIDGAQVIEDRTWSQKSGMKVGIVSAIVGSAVALLAVFL